MIDEDVFRAIIQSREREILDRLDRMHKKSATDFVTALCIFLYSNNVPPDDDKIAAFLKEITLKLVSNPSNKNSVLLIASTMFDLYPDYRRVAVNAYKEICAKLAKSKYS